MNSQRLSSQMDAQDVLTQNPSYFYVTTQHPGIQENCIWNHLFHLILDGQSWKLHAGNYRHCSTEKSCSTEKKKKRFKLTKGPSSLSLWGRSTNGYRAYNSLAWQAKKPPVGEWREGTHSYISRPGASALCGHNQEYHLSLQKQWCKVNKHTHTHRHSQSQTIHHCSLVSQPESHLGP